MFHDAFSILFASRESPLARAQVQEVLAELRKTYPNVSFSCVFTKTTGDIDRLTSLRSLDKTDFFTKELDRMVLAGRCAAAIHAAKDLPEPLPEGLTIAAITEGVDAADVVVLREGEALRPGAIVATSSVRREEAVRALQEDVVFIDLRGTIHERLQKLLDGTADGVVVAEAALIRLELTGLNRIRLPGATAPLQGKLAIVCREDDVALQELFAAIDSRVAR